MHLHLIVVMVNDPMLSTWEDGTNVTDKFALAEALTCYKIDRLLCDTH